MVQTIVALYLPLGNHQKGFFGAKWIRFSFAHIHGCLNLLGPRYFFSFGATPRGQVPRFWVFQTGSSWNPLKTRENQLVSLFGREAKPSLPPEGRHTNTERQRPMEVDANSGPNRKIRAAVCNTPPPPLPQKHTLWLSLWFSFQPTPKRVP